LNLPSSSSTAVHRSVLEQSKKSVSKRSVRKEEKVEKLSEARGGQRTIESAKRLNWSWAVIGGEKK